MVVPLPSAVPRAAMCLVRVTGGTPRRWPKQFRFTMTLWGPCILPELHLVGTSFTHTDPRDHSHLVSEGVFSPPIHLLNPDLTLCRGRRGGARQTTLDWERNAALKTDETQTQRYYAIFYQPIHLFLPDHTSDFPSVLNCYLIFFLSLLFFLI